MRQKGCESGHDLGRSPLSCLLSHAVPHPQVGWTGGTGCKGLSPPRAASQSLWPCCASGRPARRGWSARISFPCPSPLLSLSAPLAPALWGSPGQPRCTPALPTCQPAAAGIGTGWADGYPGMSPGGALLHLGT